MSLNKIYHYLGPNSSAFMIEQERKHWLLKTNKQKRLIDPETGDTYQGRIDNMGSDIIIESMKLNEIVPYLDDIKFGNNFDKIFEVAPSGFTYNSSLNGLVFARIISTNYPYSSNFHHYRIEFQNCKVMYIPFGSSLNNDEVYADKWIVTNTPPVIKLMTGEGVYSIDVPLQFTTVDKYEVLTTEPADWSTNWFDYYSKTSTGYENLPMFTEPPTFLVNTYYEKIQVSPSDATYYYPLNETVQPFPITQDGNTYTTEGITSDDQLGYPAFWFTCNISNVGPFIALTNNINTHDVEMASIGNAGNGSKYNAFMYVGIDGDYNATPDDSSTANWDLIVTSKEPNAFTGTISDFNVPLNDVGTLSDGSNTHQFDYDENGLQTIKMVNNDAWTMIDDSTYKISLAVFNENCREHHQTPLIPVLRFEFTTQSDRYTSTLDTGYIGIRGGSGNTSSDIYEKYPYDLNKFDGLPAHVTDPTTDVVPEHMAVYAIHNTPDSIEGHPETRQTAAILLDPGRTQHPENNVDYDFYWISGSKPPGYLGMNSSAFPDEFRSDLFFIKIFDPGHDLYDIILNRKGTGRFYCFDEDKNYVCCINSILDPVMGQPYYNTANWSIKYFPFYVFDHVPKLDWSHCKNTKTDGSGYEYIDIVYEIPNTTYGAGDTQRTIPIEEDRYFSFRIYRNLDLSEANYTRGRVYVLSNDPIEYENNRTTLYPKPARTAARICDIPTSVAQLSGVTNVAPTYVVDKDYVRSEASYSEEDRDRLYNINSSRWVRPIHLDINGDSPVHTNDYIFTSLEALNSIDLVEHNHFRYINNLVPMVNPADVEISAIVDRGEDYAVDDTGFIYIGGFGFQYTIEEVDDGIVTRVSLSYPDINQDSENIRKINLANFNMSSDSELFSFTEPYGTTPLTGDGRGLKVQLHINNYASILPYPASIYEDLFALVRDADGLWLYQYELHPIQDVPIVTTGEWKKEIQISQFEAASANSQFQSTSDAFMSSILPREEYLPVFTYESKMYDYFKTINTASFVQVIDENATPIKNYEETYHDTSKKLIDLNQFCCIGTSDQFSVDGTPDSAKVLARLENGNQLRYDCFIAWRPIGESNTVEAYIFYRSFNNLRSNQATTKLPPNALKYQRYVNSNSNTTITWNVPYVGPVMWVFNPRYIYQESYRIDPKTNQFVIDREKMNWTNVKLFDRNGDPVSLVDEDNKMLFNIITNSPYQGGSSYDPSIIYNQPDFHQILSIGQTINNDSQCIKGAWQCVFPRVNGFEFTNDDTTYIASPLQVLHNVNIGYGSTDDQHIIDVATGLDVTNNTLLMDDTSDGVIIKAFNAEKNIWETI